ncbi:leucyl aminopeptidase [Clostridium sediminicola]|uniref:leucyl aminopeptidase n=1 Tax=Clostridium sediminicola TaxID=3114879 RepID=UPI0031F25BB0
MKISLINELTIANYEGLIFPMYEEELYLEGITLPLEQLEESKRFEGKAGSLYKMTLQQRGKLVEVVLVGLGKRGKISYRKLINTLADSYRMIKKQKVVNLAIIFNNGNLHVDSTLVKATVEAMLMADYKFDDYLSEKKEVNEIRVDLVVDQQEAFEGIINEAKIIASANLIARDLVNQPANVMHPVSLAQRVRELGKEKGFEVEVLGLEGIQKLGMEAYLAVAKASSIEPQFIIMRYKGNPDSDEILGYVGKGLTYDSGGLCIKSKSGMVNMKDDMGGAAAVIGAMCAIADGKLKHNVTAVVAACENMISGNSYRPGDIINSMGGKTIFIGNTDAEGRLTLIDAMHYIVSKEKVNKVLDIATLTGAALYCTGNAASVAISNDDSFFNAVNDSFTLSGEQIWRMPIFDEYKSLIKHEEADLTNAAGNPGTITAGLFIGEFNGDLPWVHIDIAGTIWSTKEAGILSKGGTGIAVRSLYYLAKEVNVIQ